MRDNQPKKLLTQKDRATEGSTLNKVAIYSVDASPVDENLFCTSGRDKYIRIYDRRKLGGAGEDKVTPMKKFCPHHLVS